MPRGAIGSLRISLRRSRHGWPTPGPARPSSRARICRISPISSGDQRRRRAPAAGRDARSPPSAVIGSPPAGSAGRTGRRSRSRGSGARCRRRSRRPARPHAADRGEHRRRTAGARSGRGPAGGTRRPRPGTRDSSWWVTSTSCSACSTSSKTRCSGSANEVAVYSIRADSGPPPQSQSRAVAAPPGGSPAPARRPATDQRRPPAPRRQQQRRQRPGDAGQLRSSAVDRDRIRRADHDRDRRPRPIVGQHQRRAATPGRRTPRPAMPIPASMLGGLSVARVPPRAARPGQEADPERLDEGRHRQPRGQRDRRDRQRHARSPRDTPGAGSPWISACSSSHSLTNAVPGGSADAASAPSPKAAVVRGHPGAQPAEVVQVAAPGGAQHRPGRLEQQRLEGGMVDHVQQRRGHRQRRPACGRRSAANSPAAPTPISTSPMFSVVEYASSRFRSVRDAACRIPYTADTAPSASTSSHHQRGAAAEQVEPDPHDAVHAEVHHGRRHQRGHVARRLRVRPRAARRAAARCRPWTRTRRGAAGRPAPRDRRRQTCRAGAQRGEGAARRVRGEAPAGRAGSPPARGASSPRTSGPAARHRRPPPVLGEHQQQRGQRHQLPAQQERGDAGRRPAPAASPARTAAARPGRRARPGRAGRSRCRRRRPRPRPRPVTARNSAAERIHREHALRTAAAARAAASQRLSGIVRRRRAAAAPVTAVPTPTTAAAAGAGGTSSAATAHRVDGDAAGRGMPRTRRGHSGDRRAIRVARDLAHRPVSLRSAVDDRLGPRRAAGDLQVHRHDVADRARDPVGTGEHPAVPGAVADRDNQSRVAAPPRRCGAAARPCSGSPAR